MEIHFICGRLSRTHFHTVTATSLQSISLQQQKKWHPCYRVMTGNGWFVRINHPGNSDELWRAVPHYVGVCSIASANIILHHCHWKAEKHCLPVLRLSFWLSAKNTKKHFSILVSTALSPLQSARLQGLAENLNASMHITLPLFKGLIMQMFCEINEMKRSILNSHSWLELARLALFLFVCLLLCFVVLENPRLGFSWCHCRIASSQGREVVQQHSPGDVNWLCFALACVFLQQCVPNLLHCHPTLMSSFPRSPMPHLACPT